MNDDKKYLRTPLWMTALIVIVALPVFSFPVYLQICPSDVKALVWVYPVYVLAGAWLAWLCYPQRRALSWILVALMALSHAAVWIMATTPAN